MNRTILHLRRRAERTPPRPRLHPIASVMRVAMWRERQRLLTAGVDHALASLLTNDLAHALTPDRARAA